MPITTQSADGITHEFPDGTKPEVIDRVMKEYAGKAEQKSPSEKRVGALESLKTGLMDPVYGAAQLGARMAPEGAIPTDFEDFRKEMEKTVDKTVADRERAYRAKRGPEDGVDWARIAGSIANPLNYVGLAAGGLPGAAISGATTALLQPTINTDNYAGEKAKEGLLGAAFGGVGTAATTAVGKAISPILSKAAQELLSKGVELTPGQLAGGILRRAEEAAKSFPILGSFIRGAEGRSIETFDKSVLNQALEPIGEKLPSVVKAGREAIDYANARLSNAYDELLPQMKFSPDNQFVTDMANVRMLASEMPKPQQEQFDTIIQNRLKDRLQRGITDGKKLKQIESELTHVASQYRGSSDAAQRELAARINDVRSSLREALQRQNPAQAEELKKINAGYAMFTRAQSAAVRRATSEGVFTPNDLLASIKAADKTVRKGDFARGDALMQEYAEWGQSILPGKLPDSGTTERMMWDMLGLGTALVKPEIPAALFAASAPYTKAGGSVVRKIAQPGPARQAVGGAIKTVAPLAAPASANVGLGLLGQDARLDKMIGQ